MVQDAAASAAKLKATVAEALSEAMEDMEVDSGGQMQRDMEAMLDEKERARQRAKRVAEERID